jgi:hypothetical protein
MLPQSPCAPGNGSRALCHVVAPELTCWTRSCGTRGGSGGPPEPRGGGPELPSAWQYLSPLTWRAGVRSCRTRGGAWMFAPPLILTWSLYAGLPGLQGIDKYCHIFNVPPDIKVI